MENQYDRLQITLGHHELFGGTLSVRVIVEIITKYPAFQWLDLAAKIEGFLLIKRRSIPDPQVYLSQKLFPQSTQRRLEGRPTHRATVFSLGQLNVFRKLVIGYGEGENAAAEIPIPLADISKVLLGCQDLHNRFDESVAEGDFENFCQYVLRNGYLNSGVDPAGLFCRAYEMYSVQAGKTAFRNDKRFGDFFSENVGLGIEQAMALAFALANPLFQNEDTLIGQTTIIDPSTYFEATSIDPAITASIVDSMVVTYADAKKEILKELAADFKDAPIGYNVGLFRKTPLLKFDNGKLVNANFPCFIQKTTQNLIWMPKSRMSISAQAANGDLVNELTRYRGELFGEYLKWLCGVMAEKNTAISFHYIPAAAAADSEEVSDAILIQGDRLIVIEAKSRQFNEAFKYTGDWSKDEQFIGSLINEAAKQIQGAVDKILSGKVPSLPIKPDTIKKIYPIVLTYEPIPMHAKMQRLVRQHVKDGGMLTTGIFAPIEVMDISDMESFMDCADSHTLIEMLEKKDSSGDHASETSFHNFLTQFVASNTVISNGWQSDQLSAFFEKVCKPNLTFK